MSTVTRSQKIRLGIFVATGLFLLLASFVILAGRAMIEKRDTYTIRFTNRNISFSGLDVGSDVTYSGIKIGRVEKIRIAPDDVSVIEVIISVPAGTPIAKDSKASIASLGITGLKYVELSRGTKEAGVLEPGGIIPAGETLIDELSAKATTIADKLDDLLENIQAMTGQNTQRSFGRILDNAAGLLEDNRQNIADIVDNARVVTGNVAEASNKVVTVLDRADALLDDLSDMTRTLQGAVGPGGELQQTLVRVGKLVDRINLLVLRSEQDLDITLSNLREASANLSEFSQEFRENPTILFGGQQNAGIETP